MCETCRECDRSEEARAERNARAAMDADDARTSRALGWAVAILAALGLVVVVAFKWHDARVARAFNDGLAKGLQATITVQAEPKACEPLAPSLEALKAHQACAVQVADEQAECDADFKDYQRTEAANRANARLLGWNDGYALCRADWRPDYPERAAW
jgi:hypothetical protein